MPEKSFEFQKTQCLMGVRTNGSQIGLLAVGSLKLGVNTYQVISGPWNRGVLPNGTYAVQKYDVVASSNDAAFKSETGKGWFIPLKQPANVRRSGFGIHPDGNVEGTAGCIGLVGADAEKFWKAWLELSMSERPSSMIVSGASESGKEKKIISAEGNQE